ncbi:hypothetical protein EVJ32_04610 [Exiguobacterium sp. SH5S4]|uniref:hypothetical protein n=1 Tax=Exiguobacterium sp. SH5S4 TaxID=2510961 RepID=UPI0010389438|nr:hypothetical protein [Exiguobacterium sp. SH5S4]TCI26659.1 hypothetical protein EVJ32_04610 [Exiguobacterium sp. SH5S4]
MMWLALLVAYATGLTVYAVFLYLDLDVVTARLESKQERYEEVLDELSESRSTLRDLQEELYIAQADLEEAKEGIGVWKDRYLEAVNAHSLLADEREQSIGDRHDLVILGDDDVFVAYYHGELVVGQKRMSFNGYEDDTYRFEVTFGNTKDEGNVIYFDGGEYE